MRKVQPPPPSPLPPSPSPLTPSALQSLTRTKEPLLTSFWKYRCRGYYVCRLRCVCACVLSIVFPLNHQLSVSSRHSQVPRTEFPKLFLAHLRRLARANISQKTGSNPKHEHCMSASSFRRLITVVTMATSCL